MRKFSLILAASVLALAVPAAAQEQDPQTHGRTYGGHYRHSHRDWSGAGGRGHVHNVCWHNHHGKWVWVCR